MGDNIRVRWLQARLMEKARQHIITATCMRENTPRAAVMGMEYTHLQMARNTRVHGFRTSSTAKAPTGS